VSVPITDQQQWDSKVYVVGRAGPQLSGSVVHFMDILERKAGRSKKT
jgi:hypothetical protein